MKNAYRLFVGLLVCATAALALADEVIVENASNKSEILTPMDNGNSVWVKGTTDLIRLYSGSTAGVPSTSKGLKIGGGVDRTSQIKVLTTDMQNLPLTTVLPNGILSISNSDTGSDFSNKLSIDGGKVVVEKQTYNLNNGGNISISSGSIEFASKFRIGYDSGTSTFTQTGGTVKINGEFLVGYYAGSVGVFNMSGGTLSVNALTLGEKGATYKDNGEVEKAAAKGTATFKNVTNQFSGNVTVGNNGKGTLVLDASTVTIQKSSSDTGVGYLYIGNGAGSSGEVTLKNGSTINLPHHSMRVGYGGTGVLNMQPGSTYNGCEIYLGYNANSIGTLNIDKGTIISKSIGVGNNGTGYLNIGQGSSVEENQIIQGNTTTITFSSGNFFVGGYAKNSTGTGFADISNTTISGVSDVFIGRSGTGTLNLDASKLTILGYFVVGGGVDGDGKTTKETGTGTINLTNGATLSNTSHSMRIGESGKGTINVKSNSTLDSSSYDIHLAHATGGDGTLKIDGGTVKANNIMVGSAGTGLLEVKNGGTITLASGKVLYVGYGAGTDGTFNMAGSESTVTAGALYVGNKDAKVDADSKPIANVATISGGSFTSSGNIFVAAESGSLGVLNVEGGTLTGKGELRIGRYGDGTMTVKNNAVVSSTGVVNVGQYDGSTGVLNVQGGTLEAKTDFYVGNVGKGTMTISGGNVTIKGKLNVGYDANSTSAINVTGGSLTGTSELLVGYYGKGTVTITGGDVSFAGLVNVGFEAGSVGDLSIKNGSFTNTNSASTFRIGRKAKGTVEVLDGGKLFVENTNTQLGYYSGGDGTLTINGGTANLNTLQIGYASGSTGELKALGGKLNVFNEISVGYNGTGSAVISGGVVTTGNFVVKSGMTANLTGGTLNVGSYVNNGTTTFNGTTINLGSGGVINSTGTFTATSGSVVMNPGSYYSESDQILIGRFADADTANSVKNLTTVPEGWSTAVVDFSGSSAVVAQYGSEPTSVKIWTNGEGTGSMSEENNWSGSGNTGFVVGGTNTFNDFSGNVVIVDGTNTFSQNAPVPEGQILVVNGGTTTYGIGDKLKMFGTLVINGGTFQPANDKNLVVTGSESAPAYLEVNGGTLLSTRRVTVGYVKSDNNNPTAIAVINGGYVQIGSSNGGGLHIGDNDKDGVIAELKINGGSIQINNSQPIHIGGGKNSNGTLTMTGGNITTGGAVYLGGNKESGTGTLTMTNGSFVIGGKVYLGYNSKSTGKIDFSGGTFTASGAMDLGRDANSEGTINISGGTFTVAGEVIVGRGADSTGKITISKKSLTTLGTLTVATGDRSTGTIDVSKGKLTVNNIQLGRADAGESAQLNISEGGVVEITNSLYGVENSLCGIVTISNTGQMILNSSYSDASKAGIRELSGFNIEGVGGDGSGAMLFVKSLDSSVPITLTNDATIGINQGTVFTQREAINSVPKRSAAQPALTVTGGGTLVLTNSELGSLNELTVDGDGTTVKIDNPGNTTNIHLASILLNGGGLEVGEGTILDPGYEDDELPTTVAIEGDGRVILRGALLLDAYTTEKATGMDKLDFTGLDPDNSEVVFGDDFNIVVHLNDVNDFLGQVVNLAWAPGLSGDLINDANIALSISNSDGKIMYWGFNEDGSIYFADANAIPEPSTWALLILGAAGLLFVRKRKN